MSHTPASPWRRLRGRSAQPAPIERVDGRSLLRAFDDAAIGMALVGPDGRFRRVNPAFGRFLGYPERELLGRTVLEVTHPDDRAAARQLTRGLLTGAARSFAQEKRYLTRDGRVVRGVLTATLVRVDDGAPDHFLAQITDVTARRDAEAALARSEERRRIIVENLPDLVTRLDREGRVLDTGGARETPPPLALERLVGLGIDEFLPAEVAERFAAALAETLASGQATQLEYALTIDRTLRHREARVAALPGDEAIVIIRDVTDRRAVEEVAARRASILEAVAGAARALAGSTPFERAVPEALALLGTGASVDRVYVFENVATAAGDRWVQRFEWTAPGIASVEGHPTSNCFDWHAGGYASWGEAFARGEAIAGSLDDFPEAQRWVLLAQDVRSVAGVPILVDGSWWGCVGFDACRDTRHWSSAEIDALHAAAGLLGSALERRRFEQALRRRDAILDAVGQAAAMLLETPLRDCGREIVRLLGEAAGASRCYVFEDDAENLAGTFRFEWCAPGVAPSNPDLWSDPHVAATLVEWYGELNEGRPVRLTFSTASDAIRPAFEADGIRSLLNAPIAVHGAIWGSIGFDDCEHEREWLPAEVDAMRAAASLLGSAIGRESAEGALRESEEMLRQSQKMEAVGRLAGGIAHDFNNLLTAITGYSDLLLDRLEPGAEVRRDVEEIRRAAERAGSLTSQLLAFSRRQILAPRVLDLNAAVSETQRLLERLIGEDVELVVDLAPDAGSVRVDPGQLQHALLNLVVNARDAMPAGGRLVIATGCSGPGDRRPDLDLDPVRYAVIRVTDTGCGMDEHVARLAFEPFFTTKEAGTGLGLSMVYGLVKQSGGDVAIETAAGAGTTFTIFLPTPVDAPEAEPPPGIPPAAGGRTVLVAEDEPTVRELVRAVLERAGYTVLVAANGLEALAVADRHPGRIDLLLTDVVMPRLGGRELAERLTGLRPDTKVVLVSGYTDDAGVHEGVSEGGAAFVQKPFTSSTLLARIAEVLAARPAA